MSTTLRPNLDKSAFFRFIAQQAEGRFEFEEGRIVQQMTGGTLDHMLLVQRFVTVLERQLDPGRWLVTSQGRGVETLATVRYPDVVLEAVGAPGKGLATASPSLVIEVMSPSSETLDQHVKPPEYMGLSTLTGYIVASQDEARCQVWLRRKDRGFASLPKTVKGHDSKIAIKALGLTIQLADIYSGIV